MPLAKSWVEELVAEYLVLKGMFVASDVKAGERRDIDVVAVDPRDRSILLVDIKGDWTGSAKDICEGVIKRLSMGEDLVRKMYGDIKVKKMLVLIDISSSRSRIEEIKNTLREQGIEVKTVSELIQEIIRFIDEWRSYMKRLELVSEGTKPAVNDNLYLLKLLEFLKDKDLVKY